MGQGLFISMLKRHVVSHEPQQGVAFERHLESFQRPHRTPGAPTCPPHPALMSLHWGWRFPHRSALLVLENSSPLVLGSWNPPCPQGCQKGCSKAPRLASDTLVQSPGWSLHLVHTGSYPTGHDAWAPRPYPRGWSPSRLSQLEAVPRWLGREEGKEGWGRLRRVKLHLPYKDGF